MPRQWKPLDIGALSCRSVAAGIGGQDRNGKVANQHLGIAKMASKHNDFKIILEQRRAIRIKLRTHKIEIAI
jgi:hypothetical protein